MDRQGVGHADRFETASDVSLTRGPIYLCSIDTTRQQIRLLSMSPSTVQTSHDEAFSVGQRLGQPSR